MNKIYIIFDFERKTALIERDNVGSFCNDVFFGFTDATSKEDLKKLNFGFDFKKEKNTIKKMNFPPKGVKYIEFKNGYILSERLNTEPDNLYDIIVWAKKDDVRIEKTFTLEIPKPTKPFESWVWNNELLHWEAPIPYPQDDKEYEWDEENQNWVKEVYEKIS